MGKKKSFGESLEAFFAGKGFYIVLFLCVAVIGVSAWAMLTGKGTDVEAKKNVDMSLAAEATAEVKLTNDIEDYPPLPVSKPQEAAAPEETEIAAAEQENEQYVETSSVQPAAVQPEPETFVWPVAGAVENPYSVTALIYSRTMHDWRTHEGLDIAATIGTQVKAVSSGTVREVFNDDMYGTTVVIEHQNGLCSRYCNLAELPTVNAGDGVTAGQVIGAVGDTALCETGEVAHLHFEMSLDGSSVDPTDYMP